MTGDVPMMLLHPLAGDGSWPVTGGWVVVHLREEPKTGAMFGLFWDRDQMLKGYTVVADAD